MKSPLSPREEQILQLIADEYSTVGIARKLHISYDTALSHRKNLLRKMGAKNAAGLVCRAFETGLLMVDSLSEDRFTIQNARSWVA